MSHFDAFEVHRPLLRTWARRTSKWVNNCARSAAAKMRRHSMRRRSSFCVQLDPIEEVSHDSQLEESGKKKRESFPAAIEQRPVSIGYSVNAPVNVRPRLSSGTQRVSIIVQPEHRYVEHVAPALDRQWPVLPPSQATRRHSQEPMYQDIQQYSDALLRQEARRRSIELLRWEMRRCSVEPLNEDFEYRAEPYEMDTRRHSLESSFFDGHHGRHSPEGYKNRDRASQTQVLGRIPMASERDDHVRAPQTAEKNPKIRVQSCSQTRKQRASLVGVHERSRNTPMAPHAVEVKRHSQASQVQRPVREIRATRTATWPTDTSNVPSYMRHTKASLEARNALKNKKRNSGS